MTPYIDPIPRQEASWVQIQVKNTMESLGEFLTSEKYTHIKVKMNSKSIPTSLEGFLDSIKFNLTKSLIIKIICADTKKLRQN